MFQIMLEFDEEWAADDSHHIQGRFDCEIGISPTIALRRARTFLAGKVTMMSRVGEPILVLGQQARWRVPAYFNFPHLGEAGTLGSIEVDAQTGEVIPLTTEQIAAMKERANVLAFRLTPQTVTTV